MSGFVARLYYVWRACLHVSTVISGWIAASGKEISLRWQRIVCAKQIFGFNDRLVRNVKEELECYICLEPIWHSVVTNMLPCTHNERFHTACLWKWVREKSEYHFNRYGTFYLSCPICRKVNVTQICNTSHLNRTNSPIVR